ncbi:MAG: hypothetical protein JWL85_653 [Candidatus Saccharibacteria bacterium]|nr:hypothetical protein [Candidatus Saccharibacteria bacterium]
MTDMQGPDETREFVARQKMVEAMDGALEEIDSRTRRHVRIIRTGQGLTGAGMLIEAYGLTDPGSNGNLINAGLGVIALGGVCLVGGIIVDYIQEHRSTQR